MHLRLTSPNWVQERDIAVRGYFYNDKGEKITGKAMIDYFRHVRHFSEFSDVMKKVHGLFNVIINTSSLRVVSIDSTRIFPIFYNLQGYMSDDPSQIPHRTKLDDFACDFYLSSGATPMGTTLLEDIRQVKPGHILLPDENFKQVPFYEYYSFTTHSVSVREVRHTLDRIFNRLAEDIGNRQVIIPLTAGNDSRLIACMMKQINHPNVFCYTVGKNNSPELYAASQTAKKLGFPHQIIDVSDAEGRALCQVHNEDFNKYFRFLGAFTNFVWLYDYVAIKKMQRAGVLSPDAVFIPGHSGDFIGGSHLVKAHIAYKELIDSLSRKIIFLSHEYSYKKNVYAFVHKYFSNRIREGILPYQAYQDYIMMNRQCHNILNSARVYEYFGYEVRLPFFEKELLDIFKSLPYEQLAEGKLYLQAVQEVFEEHQIGNTTPYSCNLKTYVLRWIKQYLKRFLSPRLIFRESKILSPLGEGELAQSMLSELVQNHIYPSPKYASSSNAILKDWYLMKVSHFDIR